MALEPQPLAAPRSLKDSVTLVSEQDAIVGLHTLLCAEKLSQRYDLASTQSSDHTQAVKRSHNPGKE